MLLLSAIIQGPPSFFILPHANLSPYPGEKRAFVLSLKSKSGLENQKPWNFSALSPQKFSVYQGGRELEKASLLAEDLKIQCRPERQRFSFPVLWGANNISMKNLAARSEIAVFTLISICSFPDNKKI